MYVTHIKIEITLVIVMKSDPKKTPLTPWTLNSNLKKLNMKQ